MVPVATLLARVAADLEPLMHLHRAMIELDEGPAGLAIAGDSVAVERVVARLVATSIGATQPGEAIAIRARTDGPANVVIDIGRPLAFAGLQESALLTLEHSHETEGQASLLGAGFALRLARNLAVELGGGLVIAEDRLTLRLPAALDRPVEQQSSH
jgi:signal transduction histidine kinase